jgi:steroid delta-isomerase-like uncharacterized protein
MGAKENEALIRMIYDEYNKGNYDVYDECFADNFVSIRHDGTKLNKDEYRAFYQNVLNSFPDIQRNIKDLIVTDDRAAMYYVWTGTDKRGAGGRTPTGKMLEIKEMYFITFNKDGRICEYRQYGDTAAMGVQLGMLVPKEEVQS